MKHIIGILLFVISAVAAAKILTYVSVGLFFKGYITGGLAMLVYSLWAFTDLWERIKNQQH